MNIEQLLPETDLKVFKVTQILTEGQNKLLAKLADGKLNSGYRQDEVEQAIADIRTASIEACQQIFNTQPLQATEENKSWPWFDISTGESKDYGSSKLYQESEQQFLAEFVVKQANGGEFVFKHAEDVLIKLAPGEMLVASRATGHEFKIEEIISGLRFTLMTHVHP